MEFPFDEQIIDNNIVIRTFYENVDDSDLVWHRDNEDRIIEATHKTNWQIQLDNELPKIINNKIFIPKGIYHRLIKGYNNLELKIIKK